MRFMSRSLLAVGILALTLALLALAGGRIMSSMEERSARGDRQRPQQERVFAVNVATFAEQNVQPVITAYGEIASGRSLELRTAASGRLIEISGSFREGGFVDEGDLLFRIDPADAKSSRDLAESQVKEAQAELLEATAALELAEAELDAAIDQHALREQAVARQLDLQKRGVGSETAVETARLSASSSFQTELSRKQAVAQAKARILRAEIGETRAAISLGEAERRLAETTVLAPFDGILTDVASVQGRLVGNNEKVGSLIDLEALEIAFRVSGGQFSRLIDERGRIRPIKVAATLDLEGAPIQVVGTIDRAGAQVGAGQTGRTLFAKVDADDARVLRPGDFMRVDIQEPEISNVAVIPATAANSDGRVLLINDQERLEAVQVTVLRRQADSLIIGDAPIGREFVTKLQPQLGAGVKVKPVREGAGLEEKEMVALSDEDRAKYIKAIEANTFIPEDRKAQILKQLNQEMVPADVVARLAARMGGGGNSGGGNGGGADGEKISLDEDRRAKLVAFVEQNGRMPAEAKTRILAQLKEDNVPAALVERLESRMGS